MNEIKNIKKQTNKQKKKKKRRMIKKGETGGEIRKDEKN